MKIKLTYGRGVGPSGPFAMDACLVGYTQQSGAAGPRMGEGLGARIGDRVVVEGGNGDTGIINNAINRHFGGVLIVRCRIGCDGGKFPGELISFR